MHVILSVANIFSLGWLIGVNVNGANLLDLPQFFFSLLAYDISSYLSPLVRKP
jgi:hypothetical protein